MYDGAKRMVLGVVAVLLAVFALPLAQPSVAAGAQVSQVPAAGDVDCSGSVDSADVRSMIEFGVGTRTAVAQCPLGNPLTQLVASAGDINADGATDLFDATALHQCVAGRTNAYCPQISTAIEMLEAEWAANRQVVVDRITSGSYGRFGNLVLGPGNMVINLSGCPDDWSDTAGIDNGTITIGHTTALSGSLSAYGEFGQGLQAYVDYINASGGVGPDGLLIDLVVKDDGYVATQTQAAVANMLANDDPFYITTLASPNTFAVRDTLNQACVPQPLVMSAHPAWGDPVAHPWTTGLKQSFGSEARTWVKWIEANFDPGVSVAAVVMDNDFGLTYEKPFVESAQASAIIGDVTLIRHDPATSSLAAELTTLAATNPDVFISMTAGGPCRLAMHSADDVGLTTSAQALIQPSVCKEVSVYMAVAGASADGWLTFGGGFYDSIDPAIANDPFVQFMNDQLTATGQSSANALRGEGFGVHGWTHIQALQIAAELPGGLTRTNLMIALRSLTLDHPMLRDGISFAMNGAQDAYLVEGTDISVFSADDQAWVFQEVLDINNETPTCTWVPGDGCF